jgi:hypothetical protein
MALTRRGIGSEERIIAASWGSGDDYARILAVGLGPALASKPAPIPGARRRHCPSSHTHTAREISWTAAANPGPGSRGEARPAGSSNGQCARMRMDRRRRCQAMQ